MAGEFGNPEVVEEECDILIIGGGMVACGAAFEIPRWIAKAKEQGVDINVKLVDKAALDRSGAVAELTTAVSLPDASDRALAMAAHTGLRVAILLKDVPIPSQLGLCPVVDQELVKMALDRKDLQTPCPAVEQP